MSVAVILVGEFDCASERRLGDALATVEREPNVVLDLGQAGYIDSSCITRLVAMHKRRAAAGLPRETLVVTPRSLVRRIFDIARMDSLFRVVESIDDAVGRDGETMTLSYLYADGRK